MTTLSFYGAAGTVTGSCSMLDTGRHVGLIDCGLFQGNKSVRALNYEAFPFDVDTLAYVLLTHAHTDHSGLLPKLIKAGYDGPIFATRPTIDLLAFMLPDSARIQESETERENRKRQRRSKPLVEPLFTLEHAEEVLKRMRPVDYGEWVEPVADLQVRYWNAGHILGSASIEVRYPETDGRTMRLLFSGDLGPDEKTFHAEPDSEQGFDYVVCESTYGNRERADYTLAGRREALRKELVDGLARGGNIVIPSFAVERSQELLHDIGVLLAHGEIPDATVYLDSPLASKVTDVFIRYAHTLEDVDVPEDELFRHPSFRITQNVEESKALNRIQGGAIIISASGMADAGRIKHHLRNNIWRDNATVLFVGYQSPGTTGYHIQSGASDVMLHGKEYKIRATIRSIGNYSAHADQSELLDWIMERTPIAGALFLNHGDDDAREELTRLLGERGLDSGKIFRPEFDERFDLTAGTPASKGRGAPRIPEGELETDWTSDYARFSLALRNRLEATHDDAKRRALIAKLVKTLD